MSIGVDRLRLFDYNEIPLERTKAAFLLDSSSGILFQWLRSPYTARVTVPITISVFCILMLKMASTGYFRLSWQPAVVNFFIALLLALCSSLFYFFFFSEIGNELQFIYSGID